MSKFAPEAFRKACGDTGSLGLLAEEPKGPGARFNFLERPFAIVGRKKVSDVVLHDHRVSRRHAYLQILNGAVFCVDLNGSRFAGWLTPMQPVRLGSCTLRLIAESTAATPLEAIDPLAAGGLEKPFGTLEFLNGRKSQASWSIDRPLTLMGTSSWCKLRLHDSKVAPVHASLVCTHEGAWVVDLLSLTGTFLNGQRVRLARLEDKDELRIGHFAMRVHCQAGTSLAIRSIPPASQLVPSRSGAALRGPITTVDFGPIANEIACESARRNTRALDGFVDPSVKAMLESVFFPMVQQFSSVQNQMLDQFQQQMALMFQMFGKLQKEQIDVFRAELDQVQNLTREIQALQMKLNVPAVSASGLAVPEAPPFGESPVRNGPLPGSDVACAGQPQELNRNRAVGEQKSSSPTRKMANPPEGRRTENVQQNGTEVHSLLCERIAELQEDRRSRMQKMVDYLSRK